MDDVKEEFNEEIKILKKNLSEMLEIKKNSQVKKKKSFWRRFSNRLD